MAECTYLDLRKAREARKMSRALLAEAIHVSDDTLERWETGKTTPDPEDVDRIGEALEDPSLWHRWMLSHYDSYRRRYFATQNLALPVAIANLGLKIEELLGMQHAALSDAIDGAIDNPALHGDYKERVQALVAAACTAAQQLG